MEFQFDNTHFLSRIVYYGKKQVNPRKFEQLIGLTKIYFNHMFELFEQEKIVGFLEYIEQPWAEILFHPEFWILKGILDKLLKLRPEEIFNFLNNKFELSETLKSQLEETALGFIKSHRNYFTNYLIKI